MGGESGLTELVGEGGAVVHEGFAAGDDGEAAGVSGCGSRRSSDMVYRGWRAGVPAVFHVAPDAADIAAAEPDEVSGFSLVEAFALEGVELFHNGEGR